MGVLLNLTKEYFNETIREEDKTSEYRMSEAIDSLIDKWVEENNVQFIDTGKTYCYDKSTENKEERKIEIANMDFLAKSDEDIDIDYTPLEGLISESYDCGLFSRPIVFKEDCHIAYKLFTMSKKYQLIQIDWLMDALKKTEKENIECVVDDGEKKIIQCKIFDTTPIKILGSYKNKYKKYDDVYYYGEEYTVNKCLYISLDDYHFKPEENRFKFYNNGNSTSSLTRSDRFRLCKRYSKKSFG